MIGGPDVRDIILTVKLRLATHPIAFRCCWRLENDWLSVAQHADGMKPDGGRDRNRSVLVLPATDQIETGQALCSLRRIRLKTFCVLCDVVSILRSTVSYGSYGVSSGKGK